MATGVENRLPEDSLRTVHRRELDLELDRLESKIAELRVQYEQHFIDILPQPPAKLQREVVVLMRKLLKAPFKNSQSRFRLRTLITRYQTYHTYWERVNKQREDGTYNRDVFRAELREKLQDDLKKQDSRSGRAEAGMRQLYQSYETALKQAGAKADNLNFDAFKKTLIKKAKQLKSEHGAKKLHYKVVLKNGKVSIKASVKS